MACNSKKKAGCVWRRRGKTARRSGALGYFLPDIVSNRLHDCFLNKFSEIPACGFGSIL